MVNAVKAVVAPIDPPKVTVREGFEESVAAEMLSAKAPSMVPAILMVLVFEVLVKAVPAARVTLAL